MIEFFTCATFEPLIGDSFQVDAGAEGRHDAELVDAKEFPGIRTETAAPQAGADRIPFSIVFRGPAEPVLPQRIYPMSHGDLGEFAIFLVPVGRDERGILYEAVFT
jgi:hypothetical protein